MMMADDYNLNKNDSGDPKAEYPGILCGSSVIFMILTSGRTHLACQSRSINTVMGRWHLSG
jgi:hypothetical protein